MLLKYILPVTLWIVAKSCTTMVGRFETCLKPQNSWDEHHAFSTGASEFAGPSTVAKIKTQAIAELIHFRILRKHQAKEIPGKKQKTNSTVQLLGFYCSFRPCIFYRILS